MGSMKEVNARYIAAIPELVKELESLITLVESHGYSGLVERPRALLDRLDEGTARRQREAVQEWLAKEEGGA